MSKMQNKAIFKQKIAGLNSNFVFLLDRLLY